MRWGQKQTLAACFSHFGIKTRFFRTLWELSSKVSVENGASSTRWKVAKSGLSWRSTFKLAAKVALLEGFLRNCMCGNDGFECITLIAELSRKKARKPRCGDMLKCTFCAQKRFTNSFQHGDSLACICEKMFLRKGEAIRVLHSNRIARSCAYPEYTPFNFYGWPVAIWFAADFSVQCLFAWLFVFLINSELDFVSACFWTMSCGTCKKKVCFRAQNSAKNNFPPLCLET